MRGDARHHLGISTTACAAPARATRSAPWRAPSRCSATNAIAKRKAEDELRTAEGTRRERAGRTARGAAEPDRRREARRARRPGRRRRARGQQPDRHQPDGGLELRAPQRRFRQARPTRTGRCGARSSRNSSHGSRDAAQPAGRQPAARRRADPVASSRSRSTAATPSGARSICRKRPTRSSPACARCCKQVADHARRSTSPTGIVHGQLSGRLRPGADQPVPQRGHPRVSRTAAPARSPSSARASGAERGRHHRLRTTASA